MSSSACAPPHRYETPLLASRSYDAIVIGAGPTGLSTAYHLDRNTLLLDSNAAVGGSCRSLTDRGFVFDNAGHTIFCSDPYVRQLCTLLLRDNIHWQNRAVSVYSQGTDIPYSAPAGAGNPSAHNLEELIYSMWDEGIADRFSIPYHHKLWTVPLTEIETSWLGGRMPLANVHELTDGTLQPSDPNPLFGYPLRGGIQALMDGFLPYIRGDIQLNAKVKEVSPTRRVVTLADGRQFRYRSLISTMPLPELINVMGDYTPAAVRRAAKALRYVSLRCVNLGVARPAITDKLWTYFPDDTVFHRVFAQGNASPHCGPDGGFGLTFEISYSPDKPLPADGQALIDRCIADGVRVGLLRADEKMITTREIDIPYAYVIHDHPRARHVSVIRNWLDQYDIFLAGRYSQWEHFGCDHGFVAGKKAAQIVKENSYRSHVVGI